MSTQPGTDTAEGGVNSIGGAHLDGEDPSSAAQAPAFPVAGDHQPGPVPLPYLEDLHLAFGGSTFEGGDDKVKYREAARKSEYYPCKNPTELMLFVFIFKHQLSRAAATDLFKILKFVDGEAGDGKGEGRGFDVEHVPDNADHYIGRMREYFPLLPVVKREVPTKADGVRGAVYDIPLNLQYARFLKSRRLMEEIDANPGGHVSRGDEASHNCLGSCQVVAGPTEPSDGMRRSLMHGDLARSSPFLGYDGVVCSAGRRVYIGEILICRVPTADGNETEERPCRIVKIFWDEAAGMVHVQFRRFYYVKDVFGRRTRQRSSCSGMKRVWEAQGEQGLCVVTPGALVDLCEMLTTAERAEWTPQKPWRMGTRRSQEWTLCCEGFVRLRPQQRRSAVKFDVCGPWQREGGEGENFPDMRAAGVHHNTADLPFCTIGTVLYIDAFNVHGMTTQVRPRERTTVRRCLGARISCLRPRTGAPRILLHIHCDRCSPGSEEVLPSRVGARPVEFETARSEILTLYSDATYAGYTRCNV